MLTDQIVHLTKEMGEVFKCSIAIEKTVWYMDHSDSIEIGYDLWVATEKQHYYFDWSDDLVTFCQEKIERQKIKNILFRKFN